MQFIYNQSWNSGGRWHIATNVKVTEVPEKVETHHDAVIDYGQRTIVGTEVPGQEYTEARGAFDASPARAWALAREAFPGYRYPILGYVDSTVTTPAHTIVSADSLCGQVKRIKVNNLRGMETWNRRTAKKNIGKHLDLVAAKVIRLLFVDESGQTPEPLCGHCAKRPEVNE